MRNKESKAFSTLQNMSPLPGLAHAINSADSLGLLCRVKGGLYHNHMRRFKQVQTVRACMVRQKQHRNVFVFFELGHIFLQRKNEIKLKDRQAQLPK